MEYLGATHDGFCPLGGHSVEVDIGESLSDLSCEDAGQFLDDGVVMGGEVGKQFGEIGERQALINACEEEG